MSIRLGLALSVLAGCTLQPTRPAASSGQPTVRMAALDGFAAGNALCLGVEYLPPEAGEVAPAALPLARAQEPRPVAGAAMSSSPRAAAPDDRGHGPAAAQPAGGERKIDEALQFLEDIQGRDRRRLRRDFVMQDLPITSFDAQSPGIPLRADERNAEDAEERLGETGHQVLRRPLQRLMRRTSLVSRMELRLSDVADGRSERGAQGDATDEVDLGRVTMVVRPNRSGDPMEIGYRRRGFAVSTSQQQLKCSATLPISDSLFLDVRARQLFFDDSWQWRADLRWECSPATSVHLVVGEDLWFATEAAPYAHDPDAPTGILGIQFHAIHFF